MPRPTRSVKVAIIPGEVCCYKVESWEDPDKPHRVDLLAHQGNGACDCWDYIGTCSRNRKALPPGLIVEYGIPDQPRKSRTQCRHIAAARSKWATDTLRGIAERINSPHE